MQIALISVFAVILGFWIFVGFYVAGGSLRMPWVKDFAPVADKACPRISVIFAARDEEEKLPAALASLAEMDYPDLEIIAVNDRSTDGTARILDEFTARHPQFRGRFRAVHIAELPAGWLGKTHALQR